MTATQTPAKIRFAAVGDYGVDNANEAAVATLINSWNPDFVITTGDNNYLSGEASTIDQNIGQYYQQYIFPYTGIYGAGSPYNRFFPALGNHDWDNTILAPSQPYTDYFTLPGNERYYEFVSGPVHFFVIDSDTREPDGTSSVSTQALWLQAQLAAATEPWKVVYMHHPPYSSGSHGSQTYMQWNFQGWGADAVLSGHDHTYERLEVNGFPYFVNGLGGQTIYPFGPILPESKVTYNGDFGAMLVSADASQITFQFIDINGTVIDTKTLP